MVRLASPRVLVVCTGNVCRSPYIAGRLQVAMDDSWGEGEVIVESAGTWALTGQSMDPLAAERLVAVGGDAAGFTARDLTRELLTEAALVITATREHRQRVVRLHPLAWQRAHALVDLAQLCGGHEMPPFERTSETMTAGEWFAATVPWLTAQRGRVSPVPDEQSGITDPYGRDEAAFDAMVAEVEAVLPPVVRVLGRHL